MKREVRYYVRGARGWRSEFAFWYSVVEKVAMKPDYASGFGAKRLLRRGYVR